MRHQYYLPKSLFTANNINLLTVSRPKGYRHSCYRGRLNHEFLYIVSGKIYYEFPNKDHSPLLFSAGDLVFFPKRSVYICTYTEDNTSIKAVQFDIIEGELPEYLSAPAKLEFPRAGECIESFFHLIDNHLPDHPFYYLSCLYNLLWQIDTNYSKIPKKYTKLQPALLELNKYWYKNESISYYAALCDMSEVNFRRLLREYTGKTPVEYRNDLRMLNAKFKLQSGVYNVSEVAELCGFCNLSYFIRLYKKKYGYTPKSNEP